MGCFCGSSADEAHLTETEKNAAAPAVEFSHVSLTYKGAGAESLSDITFRAGKGQTIGIIGGTGSGKSSLVNLIPRFYDATEGEVRINGRNIKEYDIKNLRSHIGVVLQKAVLFKGTIADNLKWGNENAAQEDMEEALRISQAKEFVDQKQEGWNSGLNRAGAICPAGRSRD